MPSLQARVARAAFGAGIRALRHRRERQSGPLTVDSHPDAFEEGALEVRQVLDAVTAWSRTAVGIAEVEAVGPPVPSWWYSTPAKRNERTILHLHGGAYVAGSHVTHRGLASALARTAGADVFLPEYRLAPEDRFPAAVEDALASLRWLLDSGVEPGKLVIAGDSAGGGLAVATAVAARDRGLPRVAGLVCLSPWVDLTASGDSILALDEADIWLDGPLIAPAGRMYAPQDPTHPLASPLFAELHDLPPMLVHVGGHEVLLDDARRLVARARTAGVDASLGVFPGMWHVFQAIPGVPEGHRSLRECGGFVRRVTSRPRTTDDDGATQPEDSRR